MEIRCRVRKVFLQNYGVDLRNATGKAAEVPGAESFKQTVANKGKVFVVRTEPKTAATGGQVHIQAREAFSNMTIDGKKISQIEWMRMQALQVIEFDGSGNIVQIRNLH